VKRFIAIAAISATAILMACGSSIEVHHDWDQRADFNSYRTFAWLDQPVDKASGDARVATQSNDLLDQRVKRAVNSELVSKGLVVNSDSPDLVVVYHTGLQDKVNVTDWGYTYGGRYWGYGGRDIDVYSYQQGTLIVDLIDFNRKELVWRGSAQKALDTNPSPEQIDKTIQEAVKRIFSRYPPS